MTPVIDKAWSALESACNNLGAETGVSFNKEAYKDFKDQFSYYYGTFLNEFMTKETTELDEHKQAAVIVISAIKSNAIQQSVGDNEIALAPYSVALNVGFSFLLDRLNEKLMAAGVKEIEEFQLPFPIACDTPYFESLCRMLYYEDSDEGESGIHYQMSLNMIEWADRFFLLEYILLQKNEINPWMLKEKNP